LTGRLPKKVTEKWMGVFWLGFTGGEPLLNRDIVEIIGSIDDTGFFNILAVGYMYIVALLVYFMYRYPENRFFFAAAGKW